MGSKIETCPWCGKEFTKNSLNQVYCSWKCGNEVNHKRAVYRYHGLKFPMGRVKEDKRVIVEKHDYVSGIEKWRASR